MTFSAARRSFLITHFKTRNSNLNIGIEKIFTIPNLLGDTQFINEFYLCGPLQKSLNLQVTCL